MAVATIPKNQIWEQAVPTGHIACVITYLERTLGPLGNVPELPAALTLTWTHGLSPEDYRALFVRIGGPWLWSSRLPLSDDALSEILRSPATHIAVLYDGESAAGFVEVASGSGGDLTLSFIGLAAGYEGRGLGAALLEHAIARARNDGCKKIVTQTCTLDHPGALAFYQRSGFIAVRRSIEVMPDPRMTGLLEPSVRPTLPIL